MHLEPLPSYLDVQFMIHIFLLRISVLHVGNEEKLTSNLDTPYTTLPEKKYILDPCSFSYCFMQIVSDELVKLMGGEVSQLTFAKSGPTVILLAGLQGVGKTTVSAKLALYLKKQVSCTLTQCTLFSACLSWFENCV